MVRLIPAFLGALAVGAATMMKRPKSTAKKAKSKAMTAAKAVRSKITRKRAARKR